jgi:hypothetical protein
MMFAKGVRIDEAIAPEWLAPVVLGLIVVVAVIVILSILRTILFALRDRKQNDRGS